MIHILGSLPVDGFYVCVSGGMDSMTLMNFLLRSKRKFTALYFNHGTRHGEEAERFVLDQCSRLSVRAVVGYIGNSAVPEGKSEEEHWRDERYAFISGFSAMGPVLQAHHLDDAVETYVMSSMRGRPATIPYRNRRYNIIRPFLVTARKNIRDWAERHGVEWIEDPSNLDTVHDRNYVRHVMMSHVLRINPGIGLAVKKMILSEYKRNECVSTGGRCR